MKSIVGLLAAGLLATSLMPFDASAASLLGGLVKTGNNSGNPNKIVSLGGSNGGTSIGLLGSNGVSVNLGGNNSNTGGDTSPASGLLGGNGNGSLPIVGSLLGGDNNDSGLPIVGDLLGGNGVTLPVDLGEIDVGVPGVVGVNTSPAQGGGTSVGVELLGGGGGTIHTNPLDLLGNGGISVSLPGLGGVLPGDDDNGGGGTGGTGGNGSNGGTGNNGGNGGGTNGGGNNGGGNNGGGSGHGGGSGNGGGSGSGGGTIVNYFSNNSGDGSFAIPSGISDRLRALLKILADRDYLRVSNGRAVCLNNFNVAEVSGFVPQKDWGALQKALATYSQDIYTLRQLLANCRSAEQRQALNLTALNRVIAIDIGKNGQPILFML